VKVVLFCGGQGMRLREYSSRIPKPMAPIGNRPLLWHVMKYYAHFGHTDFVLCLGYRGDAIKEYFLNHNYALSNDFVLSDGGKTVELLGNDAPDWRITFVDTGLRANIGERLRAVRPHLEGEEWFLANYADTLTDAPLPALVERARAEDATALFLAVRPTYPFHIVTFDGPRVAGLTNVRDSDLRINGGYFVFRRDIFEYLESGDELVEEPFRRLVDRGRLVAEVYDGFWAPLDTLKDRQMLEAYAETGRPPWAVWLEGRDGGSWPVEDPPAPDDDPQWP
jgi:glucose-1-phosphate cytidylyltransferase